MARPRFYREEFNTDRFHTFQVQFRETDILAGVNHGAFHQSMPSVCSEVIQSLRNLLNEYGARRKEFLTSHHPLPGDPDAPPVVNKMIECGRRSGTGPMSSVAGLFAFETGRALLRLFDITELMIENGGDIYLVNHHEIYVTVYAGDSPLTNKLSLVIPPGRWGISTSSGTVGHSFSYGKADAVTIVCEDPVVSDAWATAVANRIRNKTDIEKTLKFVETVPEILGCLIIFKDRMGVRGRFKIQPAEIKI
ncbi:MAG: UPF0280 family protein [Bacteroidales bacterium]|nr:UPF0280 family protein [Bacteroidales bacterium]MBN2697388.1 UPF0280 family protein [Bacteroidales bacterium]